MTQLVTVSLVYVCCCVFFSISCGYLEGSTELITIAHLSFVIWSWPLIIPCLGVYPTDTSILTCKRFFFNFAFSPLIIDYLSFFPSVPSEICPSCQNHFCTRTCFPRQNLISTPLSLWLFTVQSYQLPTSESWSTKQASPSPPRLELFCNNVSSLHHHIRLHLISMIIFPVPNPDAYSPPLPCDRNDVLSMLNASVGNI